MPGDSQPAQARSRTVSQRCGCEHGRETGSALAARPNQARDGRRAGRSHCVSERKRRPVSRLGFGGFWRSLQQQFGELLGGVGEGEALARAVVEFVGDGVELGFGDGAEVGALGEYCRSGPLVFSLEPRCQGACGSQKKTSVLASTRSCLQSRISGP
jgi:hypothetical protein